MEKPYTWGFMGMDFNARTLVMSWIIMGIVLILGIMAGRGATSKKPKGMTNVFETVIDFIRNLIGENMPYRKGAALLSLLTTLILVIFFSNMLGLLPNIFAFIPLSEGLHEALVGSHGHSHGTMMSPTADLNITLGLALMMIIIVQAWGIKWQKGHYFKHFFDPNPVFLPIHLIELISKPITLAFRLYGNIFAGEILIGVIIGMGTSFYLGGFVAGLIWLAFSVFVGAIQAFVFTMLSIAYTAQVVGEDEGHH
jgi:F-type H+-transporting ATPase subunit a